MKTNFRNFTLIFLMLLLQFKVYSQAPRMTIINPILVSNPDRILNIGDAISIPSASYSTVSIDIELRNLGKPTTFTYLMAYLQDNASTPKRKVLSYTHINDNGFSRLYFDIQNTSENRLFNNGKLIVFLINSPVCTGCNPPDLTTTTSCIANSIVSPTVIFNGTAISVSTTPGSNPTPIINPNTNADFKQSDDPGLEIGIGGNYTYCQKKGNKIPRLYGVGAKQGPNRCDGSLCYWTTLFFVGITDCILPGFEWEMSTDQVNWTTIDRINSFTKASIQA